MASAARNAVIVQRHSIGLNHLPQTCSERVSFFFLLSAAGSSTAKNARIQMIHNRGQFITISPISYRLDTVFPRGRQQDVFVL